MRLRLWQLALMVRDHEPDGTVYATEAEAEAAKVAAAREHIEVLCSSGHNFFDMYEEVFDEQPPVGKLSDANAVRLAEEYGCGRNDEFRAAVYETWVELPAEHPLSRLVANIRSYADVATTPTVSQILEQLDA